jgi:hypothetical protein
MSFLDWTTKGSAMFEVLSEVGKENFNPQIRGLIPPLQKSANFLGMPIRTSGIRKFLQNSAQV